MRVHRGDEDQQPDPLIVAKEGAGNAPAYRGTAYVVFERLPLGRLRQPHAAASFEVVRPVGGLERDDPRGDADPRRDRVRLRAAAVVTQVGGPA